MAESYFISSSSVAKRFAQFKPNDFQARVTWDALVIEMGNFFSEKYKADPNFIIEEFYYNCGYDIFQDRGPDPLSFLDTMLSGA